LWTVADLRRITPIPPGHWILLQHEYPFRARLQCRSQVQNVESCAANSSHVACLCSRAEPGDAELSLETYDGAETQQVKASLRFLAADPTEKIAEPRLARARDIVLLTNNRGGMCRMAVALGTITSKYDC